MTTAYGYGLRWLKDGEGRTFVGHSGGLPGFGSNWFIMPDYGIGAILFTNNTYAPASEINLQVLDTLIKEAQLKPRQLPPIPLLEDRKKVLTQLLPDWDSAKASGLFADNFFLDVSVRERKKEAQALFKKAGKIIRVNTIVPESQLCGYFIIEGERTNLKVHFSLTPQNPALIHEVKIELSEPVLMNHPTY